MAASGLLLTLSSLLLGTRYWGYQRAVQMLQAGGLLLVLGMFYRLTGNSGRGHDAQVGPLAHLFDMEAGKS